MSWQRFWDAFCTTGVIALMLLVLGPAAIFAGNPNDFTFAFVTVLPALLLVAAVLAAVLAVPVALLPGRAYRLATAAASATAVMLWVQATFFQWKYGPLSGQSIDWTTHTTAAHLQAALWVGVLAVSIIASERVFRGRGAIRTALLAANFVALAMMAKPLLRTYDAEYFVDEHEKFTFSSTRNVIVLVLDTYQTDIFNEIVEERTEVPSILQGFTYYRNAVGGFSLTLPSLPLMLTGKYYDNSKPYRAFVNDVFTGESVPGAMLGGGFKVDLFPSSAAYLKFDTTTASNATLVPPRKLLFRRISELIDLSTFRHAPLYLKPHVYADDRWLTRRWLAARSPNDDLDFFAQMHAEAHVDSAPRFKLFHLRGLHAPLSYDQRLQLRPSLPVDRPTYKAQALGLMTLIQRFLEDVNRLGVYDKSVIAIVGDHGTSGYGVDVDIAASGHEDTVRPGFMPRDDKSIVESGLPLVLFKPLDATGRLKISDAPIMHADLPKTLTGAAGVAAFGALRSYSDIAETETRRRRFLSYSWTASFEDAAFFPPMHEFWVSGFSWLRSSWEPSFKVFTPAGSTMTRPSPLPMPTTVDFTEQGNSATYVGVGWARQEKAMRWTDGRRASLVIPVPSSRGPVRLRATISPLISPPRLLSQRIRVFADARQISEWSVTAPGQYEAIVPATAFDDGELDLELQLPDATSPEALGLGRDLRTLAIAVTRVELSPVAYYEAGTRLTFGANGTSGIYQRGGWAVPEAGFTWTLGRQASMEIPVRADTVMRLTASVTPLVDPEARPVQRVVVKVAGREIDRWDVAAPGQYSTTIPTDLMSNSILQVTFELPDAITPKALNRSVDTRLLGVAFASVAVTPAPVYEYGSEIAFGTPTALSGYRPSGWAAPEAGFRWTEGDEATLILPVRKPDHDLTLTVRATPLLAAPRLTAQRVQVRVGDLLVGTWRLTADGDCQVTIPSSAAAGGILRLRFLVPDAATPESLGLGHDTRRLAVAFHSLKIS